MTKVQDYVVQLGYYNLFIWGRIIHEKEPWRAPEKILVIV